MQYTKEKTNMSLALKNKKVKDSRFLKEKIMYYPQSVELWDFIFLSEFKKRRWLSIRRVFYFLNNFWYRCKIIMISVCLLIYPSSNSRKHTQIILLCWTLFMFTLARFSFTFFIQVCSNFRLFPGTVKNLCYITISGKKIVWFQWCYTTSNVMKLIRNYITPCIMHSEEYGGQSIYYSFTQGLFICKRIPLHNDLRGSICSVF